MKPAKASLFVLSDCMYNYCNTKKRQTCPGRFRSAPCCKGFCPTSQPVTIGNFAFKPKELEIADSGQTVMVYGRQSLESSS
jgi:hypothetical protein